MSTDKDREEFEKDKLENTAVQWNGRHYSPTDDSKYSINIAHAMNLGFAEFKRGRASQSDPVAAEYKKELDHLRKETEALRLEVTTLQMSLEIAEGQSEWVVDETRAFEYAMLNSCLSIRTINILKQNFSSRNGLIRYLESGSLRKLVNVGVLVEKEILNWVTQDGVSQPPKASK